MKYTQGYSKAKFRFGAGFYVVVACCLLLVGGASWFALSKISKKEATPKVEENSSEYGDNTSSYIESVPEIPQIKAPTEEAAKNVTGQPYTKEESTARKTTISFTMPVQGKIIKDHSSDRLQYSATFGDMRLHTGIDIECEKGTSVSSCADGTVLSVIKDASYGNVIEIDHKNGITVKYAALDDITVKEGDTVEIGQIIGKSATVPSECNDKNHLHLEVFKDGKPVAPLKTLGLS